MLLLLLLWPSRSTAGTRQAREVRGLANSDSLIRAGVAKLRTLNSRAATRGLDNARRIVYMNAVEKFTAKFDSISSKP